MASAYPKLAAADLPTVIARATLPPEARPYVAGCVTVEDAVARLEAAKFTAEAVRVLAHALPKREGVWWACMCAGSTQPADLPEHDRQALETAELWVRRQRDDVRRAAMAHAEAAGMMTAEAWCGIAAFWSGDSLAPLGKPAEPPLPFQPGTAIAAGVILASVRGNGRRLAERMKRFLDSGRDIAAGGQGRLPREPG